jgi:hypothetical protein
MEALTNFLAVGTIFIFGLVLLIMVFQILAFYIAGRVTDSINDELISAFTLFGVMFFIGAASTLVNAILTTFLPGMLIPAIGAFIVYLVVIIYAIVIVYELSIPKAILHFILSLVITVALTGIVIYIGTLLIPQGGYELEVTDQREIEFDSFEMMEFEEFETFDDFEEDAFFEEEPVIEEEFTTTEDNGEGEEGVGVEVLEEEVMEEELPSGPGLPGSNE